MFIFFGFIFTGKNLIFQDILKKCQQAVNDHKCYQNKYTEFNDWMDKTEEKLNGNLKALSTSISQGELTENMNNLKQILDERPTAVALLNSVVELGEKLYLTTAEEGRQVVREQLEKAQLRLDSLFDKATNTQREIQTKLSR